MDLYQVGGDHDALLKALARTAHQFEDAGPETVDELLRFGLFYYERAAYAEAGAVMRTLLQVFPNSAPLLSSLGVVLIESEELDDAIALFRRARALAPDDALVVRNLASAAMYLGKLEEAESALEALHALAPEETRVLFELAVVTTARDPERAHAAWKRYLDLHATQPDADDWAEFARSSFAASSKPLADDSVVAMARALSEARG